MSANPWLQLAVTSDDLPILAAQDTATCQHCRHWSGSGGNYGVCISTRTLAVLRHCDERCEQFRMLGGARTDKCAELRTSYKDYEAHADD